MLNEVTGKDHKWFVDQVYTSSNTFDYSIDSLTSEPIESRGLMEVTRPASKFQETEGRRTVPHHRRGTPARRGAVPGRRAGDVRNGEQARETWDGHGRWQVFTFDRPVKAVSAQIDPERRLLLDTNYTNNSKTLEPATDRAATKWSLRWMVWLQDLFMTYAFLV